MKVDFTHDELRYIANEVGMKSWQSGLAESIEAKCRSAIPEAKRREEAIDKAARIASLRRELADLEKA